MRRAQYNICIYYNAIIKYTAQSVFLYLKAEKFTFEKKSHVTITNSGVLSVTDLNAFTIELHFIIFYC